MASAEKYINKLRAKKTMDAAKLDFALAEIEAVKRKVHESHCKVSSPTKKVETSNNHRKPTSKALEKANLQL